MFFDSCANLDELKAAYRKAAMKYHPDRGGDTATMQRINNEYEAAFNRLKNAQNAAAAADTTGATRATAEQAQDFIEIINRLLRLDGLKIELCGRWLWITGDTIRHKAELKAAGCKWAAKKKAWTWHFPEDGDVFSRGRRTMAQIRQKYGSQTFAAEQERGGVRLAAGA